MAADGGRGRGWGAAGAMAEFEVKLEAEMGWRMVYCGVVRWGEGAERGGNEGVAFRGRI